MAGVLPVFYTILLLLGSCTVMVVAWFNPNQCFGVCPSEANFIPNSVLAAQANLSLARYLHLKYEEWPIWKAITFSWLIAGAEYCLQVPANRIGHSDAEMSAAHLRAIAELCILVAFLVFSQFVLCEPVRWNHLVGFGLVLVGVTCVLMGPFPGIVYQGCARDASNATNASNAGGDMLREGGRGVRGSGIELREVPMHRLRDAGEGGLDVSTLSRFGACEYGIRCDQEKNYCTFYRLVCSPGREAAWLLRGRLKLHSSIPVQ